MTLQSGKEGRVSARRVTRGSQGIHGALSLAGQLCATPTRDRLDRHKFLSKHQLKSLERPTWTVLARPRSRRCLPDLHSRQFKSHPFKRCGSHVYPSPLKKGRPSPHIQSAEDKSELTKQERITRRRMSVLPKDPRDARNGPSRPAWASWSDGQHGPEGKDLDPQFGLACPTASRGSHRLNGLTVRALPTSLYNRRRARG